MRGNVLLSNGRQKAAPPRSDQKRACEQQFVFRTFLLMTFRQNTYAIWSSPFFVRLFKMASGSLKTSLTLLLTLCLFFPSTAAAEEGDAEFAYAAGYFKKERWKYASEAFADFLK